jgi:hypothetical protein
MKKSPLATALKKHIGDNDTIQKVEHWLDTGFPSSFLQRVLSPREVRGEFELTRQRQKTVNLVGSECISLPPPAALHHTLQQSNCVTRVRAYYIPRLNPEIHSVAADS